MLSYFLDKFGGIKLSIATFFIGASIAIPSSILAYELTVSKYRKEQISALQSGLKKQKDFFEIKQESNKELVALLSVKDDAITQLQETNRVYAAQNINFASSRAPVVERIIERGNEIKEQAAISGDACATAIISDGVRIYGNGPYDNPS